MCYVKMSADREDIGYIKLRRLVVCDYRHGFFCGYFFLFCLAMFFLVAAASDPCSVQSHGPIAYFLLFVPGRSRILVASPAYMCYC